jgi:hypothetical protein
VTEHIPLNNIIISIYPLGPKVGIKGIINALKSSLKTLNTTKLFIKLETTFRGLIV